MLHNILQITFHSTHLQGYNHKLEPPTCSKNGANCFGLRFSILVRLTCLNLARVLQKWWALQCPTVETIYVYKTQFVQLPIRNAPCLTGRQSSTSALGPSPPCGWMWSIESEQGLGHGKRPTWRPWQPRNPLLYKWQPYVFLCLYVGWEVVISRNFSMFNVLLFFSIAKNGSPAVSYGARLNLP